MKKAKIKTINCEEAVSRFNEFIDNYIKGASREELVKHISECRHCFERFEFEKLLKSKVKQLSKNPKDKIFFRKIEKIISSL